MNFVIVGGDAAGLSAASRAKRKMAELNVTVLEKTGDVSYSACGMPYNIADPKRDIEDLVVRRAEVFREKQGINLLTGHCVDRIDVGEQTVSGRVHGGNEFQVAYDRLLIATGASAVMPDLPGFDLPGVFALKSLAEGRAIKQFISTHPVKKVVIIGMGYIAFEMCESLRALGFAVDMVKPRAAVLPWLEPSMAEIVQKEVTEKGAALYPGCPVERVERSEGCLHTICGDKTLVADMVLVAVGIHPNSGFAEKAGIQTGVGGAIAVDRNLETSVENVYAAGDCADAYHVVTGEKTWIPLALRANRAGWAVADNVCGGSVALDGVAGTAVFRVFDLEVAKTGLNSGEAATAGFDPAAVTIQTRSRAHAHPGNSAIHVHLVGDKATGRLLGAQMVGKDGGAHRINAAAVALHNRMTVEQFAQCDLAYAPPFGPTWDPLLTAANQLVKRL